MIQESRRPLVGLWLGRRRYQPVLRLQEELARLRREDAIGDVVLFVEHEPVITMGRGARLEHLLRSEEQLLAQGVDLVRTGRGGDVTLHAPGQLVCYPIVRLSGERRDVRRYVTDLTQSMVDLAASNQIACGTLQEHVGVWVDLDSPSSWKSEQQVQRPAKVGAIGVRISRWVTMHGFAFNLSIDLSRYNLIVPCGIRAFGVTSIDALTQAAPLVQDAAAGALELVAKHLGFVVGPYLDWTGESLDAAYLQARIG